MPHKKGHYKKKKVISQKQSVKQTVIVKLGEVKRKRAKRSAKPPTAKRRPPSAAGEIAPINLPIVAYQTGYGSFPLMQSTTPSPDPFPFKKSVEEIVKPSMPMFEDVGVGTEGFVEILDLPTKAETLADLIEPVRQQPDPFRAPSIASSPRIGDPFKIQSPSPPAKLPSARLSPPIRMESPAEGTFGEIIRSPSVSSGSTSAILSPLREEEPFLFAAEGGYGERPRTIDDFFRPLPFSPDISKAAPFDYREQSSPPSPKKPKSVSSRANLIMAQPPAIISMGTPALLPVKQTKKSLANLYQAKFGKLPPTKLTKAQLTEMIG